MVRTRADGAGVRATVAKAPRKQLGSGPTKLFNNSTSNSDSKGNKGREHTGGNSYFPRETPEWQKPITSFFNPPTSSGESPKRDKPMEFVEYDSEAGTSTSIASASKEDTTKTNE